MLNGECLILAVPLSNQGMGECRVVAHCTFKSDSHKLTKEKEILGMELCRKMDTLWNLNLDSPNSYKPSLSYCENCVNYKMFMPFFGGVGTGD